VPPSPGRACPKIQSRARNRSACQASTPRPRSPARKHGCDLPEGVSDATTPRQEPRNSTITGGDPGDQRRPAGDLRCPQLLGRTSAHLIPENSSRRPSRFRKSLQASGSPPYNHGALDRPQPRPPGLKLVGGFFFGCFVQLCRWVPQLKLEPGHDRAGAPSSVSLLAILVTIVRPGFCKVALGPERPFRYRW
jgi:hypothetical protein